MAIREPAPAKINLALHVRRRRADGYHDLETLFAFARDGDSVTVEHADEDDFAITGRFASALSPSPLRGEGRGEGQRDEPAESRCPSPGVAALRHQHRVDRAPRDQGHAGGMADPMLPGGEREIRHDNLVLRARDAFTARFSPGAAHAITLDKHLPVASGIGGGSADAAATLRALAHLHRVEDLPALTRIARTLGADVPACLLGRTAFGAGRGDDLVPQAPLGGIPALLVNPNVAVSTAAVFAAWDGSDRGALEPAEWRTGRNDLEPPARAIAPVIDDVLSWLADREGVTLARMSGSGATCFALYETAAARDRAARDVPTEWWHLATVLT